MSHDAEKLTRFLLGELPETDAAELEEGFFDNEAQFALLRAMEAELIDAYAAGELSAERRARFESRFLHQPGIAERVAFARALAEAATAPPQAAAQTTTPPLWSRLANWLWPRAPRRWVAVGLAAALVAVIGIYAVRTTLPPAAYTLEPVAVRAGDAQARIPSPRPGTDVQFVLQLDPADALTAYEVVLLVGDAEQWRGGGTAAPGDLSVPVAVPAETLQVGQYELVLMIPAPDGRLVPASYYPFSVID